MALSLAGEKGAIALLLSDVEACLRHLALAELGLLSLEFLAHSSFSWLLAVTKLREFLVILGGALVHGELQIWV